MSCRELLILCGGLVRHVFMKRTSAVISNAAQLRPVTVSRVAVLMSEMSGRYYPRTKSRGSGGISSNICPGLSLQCNHGGKADADSWSDTPKGREPSVCYSMCLMPFVALVNASVDLLVIGIDSQCDCLT